MAEEERNISQTSSTSDDDDESEEENEKAPSDIELHEIISNIAFHPSRDVIAAGTLDGDVKIFSYSTEGSNHELMSPIHHKKSCRALGFSCDGNLLFTVSGDRSLQCVDMNTGSTIHKIVKAHEDPIYSLLPIDDYLVATGDDEGRLKVWDFRRETSIMDFRQVEEFISDMIIDADKKILVATSGEGSLSAFNIRRKQMEIQSEMFDSEFLSLDAVKRGNKVVVGTGEGALHIFNWGEWGNISDRFPGHPESINSIVAASNDIICTGSNDGIIRAVNILPNRFLGIVGVHGDFPVENLSLSHDKTLLASCSHDHKIKFWNITSLEDVEEDCNQKADKTKQNKHLSSSKTPDFFAGFAE